MEAKATVRNDARTTAKFLYENIFTRFGLPIEIVSDQGVHFINEVIAFLLEEFMVVHKRSAPYHPQANGQAESSNKTICTALTKVVSESRTDWEQKLSSVLWAYRTAYKTAVGATPFDLVYGINAILPMEFLLPTLRVAKELEWTGHELSKRIEQLEQLDETRLLAIVGMYAEKRRRKYWHDQYVKTNRFRKGDLVLLYTLKKHKRKLKQRGLGPYVVSELNTSGAIRLETLDGVPMENYINGSRLKRYKEPMTENMLERLHSAQTRKEGQALLRRQAREEADARVQKARERRQNAIMPIQIGEEEDFVEPFHIQLQMHTQTAAFHASALIDSGADCNVMSHEVWNALGNPTLTSVHTQFHSFSKEATPSLGKWCIKISIQDQPMYCTFYIANKDQALVDVVLGRSWIRSTSCALDWATMHYAVQVNSSTLTGTSEKALPSFQQMETKLQQPK